MHSDEPDEQARERTRDVADDVADIVFGGERGNSRDLWQVGPKSWISGALRERSRRAPGQVQGLRGTPGSHAVIGALLVIVLVLALMLAGLFWLVGQSL